MIGAHSVDSSVIAASAASPPSVNHEARVRGSALGAARSPSATASQAPSPAHARGPPKYPPLKKARTVGPASSSSCAALSAPLRTTSAVRIADRSPDQTCGGEWLAFTAGGPGVAGTGSLYFF